MKKINKKIIFLITIVFIIITFNIKSITISYSKNNTNGNNNITEQEDNLINTETSNEEPKTETEPEITKENKKEKTIIQKDHKVSKNNTIKKTKTLIEQLTEKTEKYKIEIGNISFSNTNFSKDLVKDDGSYHYLDNNLDNNSKEIGVPIIDFRTNFQTRKTLIYAHSTPKGNGPFNYLQNYHNNKGFFEKHQYITIVYAGKTYKYQIFSVYITTANTEKDPGLEYFHKLNYTLDEWAEKIQEYKNNSEYETNVNVSKNDKILIVQTCTMDKKYYQKYYRANQLIMAKLISVN